MNIKIDLYLIISFLILTFFRQIDVFLSFYIFVILHELAHILVAFILKIKVLEISFLPFGVNAKFDFGKSKLKEIIVASAGPIFSLCMYFMGEKFKIQNLFIFLTNMIPIYPLDGGRILKNVIIFFIGDKLGTIIYNNLLKMFIILLIILNLVLIVFLRNYNFIFVSIYVIQLAGDEIKKDKIKEKVWKILNESIR